MSRFYRVKIGNVFLTSDGTATGTPCKLAVRGLENLLITFTGNVVQAADGSTHLQTALVKGVKLEITIQYLPATVLQQIKTIVQNALANGDALNILFTQGALGDFDLNVLPELPEWIATGEFSSEIIKDVIFRFVTA